MTYHGTLTLQALQILGFKDIRQHKNLCNAPEPPIAGRKDSGTKMVTFPTVHSNLRARLQLDAGLCHSLSFSNNSSGSDLQYPKTKNNMQ